MQPTSRTPDGDRLRVLIVDHHEVTRMACAALLRSEGLDVVDVAGAVSLVRLGRSWMPDVALIDVNPPAPAGEAVRQLRSRPPAPAIVLTSSAQPRETDGTLAGLPFLPKADICAGAILAAAALGPDEQSATAESE